MTDLHEIFKSEGLDAMQAAALIECYERDRMGAIPSVAQCYIDFSATLGARTKVWHYARILAKAVIGADCVIGSGAEVGRGTTIGDRTHLGANVFLPPNTRVGSDVFVGPGVVCTDDKHPRAGNRDYTAEPPTIDDGASVGAAVVLLPGVRIGRNARVAAGAVVTRDVPENACVLGSPARYIDMPVLWAAGREVA